jgi:asparagine synthetase B (glutamine-hydrolysing)
VTRVPEPSPSGGASLAIGNVALRIRPAVAVRERSLPGGTGCYLSLYDEEIDERADALWCAWNPLVRASDLAPLELTDAAIVVGEDGSVLVARGGAATFPLYWRTDDGRLSLSTALPVLEEEPFSRQGLLAALAGACVHGSYEVNATNRTPLARWQRTRRASLARFAHGRLVEERILHAAHPLEHQSRADIALEVRAAFDAYARTQSGIRSSVLEVSGGFDSTLAAALPSRAGMRGISVAFPYYEFRFESAVQRATAEFLGIPRTEIDGDDLFPYSAPDTRVRFDEPTVFVTGIRHAEQVARFAATGGAQRIYNGHGGDQCFATDLSAREELVSNPITRGPFTSEAWRAVGQAIDDARRSPWMERSLGTFVYDARPDVWVKESLGPTLRTPFADRRVFQSALAWSRWCQAQGVRPDKSILAEAASDLLPQAILERRGKVAYDGVWMRAYLRHAEHIAQVFEQTGDVLTQLGVSPNWLQRRARELGEWADKSDREVLALYAIATWLLAWGVTRAGDVDWAD